jgi:hypothetical protein
MLAQAVQLFAERSRWSVGIAPWMLCRTRADAWTVNEAIHLSLFTNRGEPDCWHGAATESWPHKDGDSVIVPERGYALGERIMCLQNTWIPREAVEGYVPDNMVVRGRVFVPNGYVGTVIGAEDGALRIRGEDGLRITLDADYARSYTDYAWAVTIHKMQGRTVECAILYRANALDYGLAFTSLTRATDETLLLMRYEDEERDRLRYEANVAAIREEAEPDDESVEDRIARLPSPQEIAMRRSTEAWIGLLNRPDEPASALAALADERRIVEMAQGLSADDCLQLAGLWRHWAAGGKPPVLDTEERTRLKEVAANPESDEEDRRSATSRLALDRASASLSAVLEWAQNLGHHPDRRFAERMAQLAEAAAVAAVSEERTLRGVEAHEAGEALVSSLGPSAHDVSPWGEGATGPRLRVRGGPRDAAAVTAAVLVSAAHETGADVLDVFDAWLDATSSERPSWLGSLEAPTPEMAMRVAVCLGAAEAAWQNRPKVGGVRLAAVSAWPLVDALPDVGDAKAVPHSPEDAHEAIRGALRVAYPTPKVLSRSERVALALMERDGRVGDLARGVAAAKITGQDAGAAEQRLARVLKDSAQVELARMWDLGAYTSWNSAQIQIERNGDSLVTRVGGPDGVRETALLAGFSPERAKQIAQYVEGALARSGRSGEYGDSTKQRGRSASGGFGLSR